MIFSLGLEDLIASQDYVRGRILDFAGGQVFAKKLYTSASTVRAAAQDALEELSRPGDLHSAKNLKLVFRHTCLYAALSLTQTFMLLCSEQFQLLQYSHRDGLVSPMGSWSGRLWTEDLWLRVEQDQGLEHACQTQQLALRVHKLRHWEPGTTSRVSL